MEIEDIIEELEVEFGKKGEDFIIGRYKSITDKKQKIFAYKKPSAVDFAKFDNAIQNSAIKENKTGIAQTAAFARICKALLKDCLIEKDYLVTYKEIAQDYSNSNQSFLTKHVEQLNELRQIDTDFL